MLERYLILWLSCFSSIAYFWPTWFSGGGLAGFDPFVASKPAIPHLIELTMFCVGGLMRREEIDQVFRQWPMVLAGTALQYTAMPLLAYVFAHLMQLGPDARLGVIMVGCVPGAMASNVLTMTARGNVSYSVSLTTASTMLSPLVVPFAMWLTLDTRQSLDLRKIALELVTQVVGPVVIGHLLCRRFPMIERSMYRLGPLIANLTILWLIAVVVGINRARLGGMFAIADGTPSGHSEAAALLTALLAINLLGYLAGYVGGTLLRLPDPMRRALTLEIGMQNAGLGTSLVVTLFPNQPAAAIPTALYTFGCMFTAVLLAQLWSRVKTVGSGQRAVGSGQSE